MKRAGLIAIPWVVVSVLLLGFADAAVADSWAPPSQSRTFSENGRFLAHAIPAKEGSQALLIVLASISTVMEWTNAKAVSEDQAKSITSFLLPNQGMGTGWLAKPEATRNGLWARLSKVTWTRVLSMVTVAETSRRLRKSFLA